MDVQRELGHGFLEIVYKDALQYEFKQHNILYEREKQYLVEYKDVVLPHYFFADFVVYNKIILEVKSCSALTDEFTAQAINYLKVSDCKLALIVNFGKSSLEYKRIVL